MIHRPRAACRARTRPDTPSHCVRSHGRGEEIHRAERDHNGDSDDECKQEADDGKSQCWLAACRRDHRGWHNERGDCEADDDQRDEPVHERNQERDHTFNEQVSPLVEHWRLLVGTVAHCSDDTDEVAVHEQHRDEKHAQQTQHATDKDSFDFLLAGPGVSECVF
ncbi:hypothetical protein GCM10009067_18410 [Haloarcula sebkhae]|uniref:Uncharacterized protein n=1 Tax=Haloarcula sebkhae TaxID=932660 RepID=A0A830EIS6_9EURY|nr:hypothetical protein GCM10009067_18410 [Haloarcula sebkhae]